MELNKKKVGKIACISLATALACGTLAGCDLITTDPTKDLEQVIAEVDISQNDDFKEGGVYAKYADAIQPISVLKRDLVANFLSYGYQYVQNYGYTYEQTFTNIKDSLVNRNMLLQYAMVALFEEGNTYTVEGYKTALEKGEAEGVAYFLTQEEQDKAMYVLRRSVNSSLDASEKEIIKQEEKEYETEVRTTPTGIDTEDEDFYDTAYKIYTGRDSTASFGTYERVDGSTPSTRRRAYNSFLASLRQNDLLEKNEDVTNVENLKYFKQEIVTAYEDALLNKMTELFEEKAESALTQAYVEGKYQATVASQKQTYANDYSSFATALDNVSDTSFLLSAPAKGYGFVINILLPFSNTQKKMLSENTANFTEGQKFEYRAGLLQSVKASDQRESWFTGETDYSYKKGEDYFFFENSVETTDGGKYEHLKNYAGTYPYNGTVAYDEEKEEYTITPDKITMDEFIAIMETQFTNASLSASGNFTSDYFAQTADDFYKTNEDGVKEVDYSKFLYYKGKVDLSGEDANDTFDATSNTNKAMSIVNELSFAYNTDTAGLNKYLGYSVSAFDTQFVKEFEYAAKEAIKGGVGTYTVAPSEYGWHVMYCTFAFGEADTEVYAFTWADIEKEGTFSNLYYEAMKKSTVEGYSSTIQTKITNGYSACVTVYEDRYQDLLDLDNKV